MFCSSRHRSWGMEATWGGFKWKIHSHESNNFLFGRWENCGCFNSLQKLWGEVIRLMKNWSKHANERRPKKIHYLILLFTHFNQIILLRDSHYVFILWSKDGFPPSTVTWGLCYHFIQRLLKLKEDTKFLLKFVHQFWMRNFVLRETRGLDLMSLKSWKLCLLQITLNHRQSFQGLRKEE